MAERGVYFISRPLTGVEFRLILEYSEPVVDILHSLDDFVENTNEQSIPALPTIPVENCTFRWQQKLHFRRNKSTTTPQLQTQICSEQDSIDQNELETGVVKEGSRVFTLVDGEKPTGIGKVITELHTHTRENRLAERFVASRSRRVEPAMMSHQKLVIDLPHKEYQMKARSIQRNKQMMYIMAYLGPIQDNTQVNDESNQYVLCKITAINGTQIIIEPDLFSKSSIIETHSRIYKARLSVVNSEKFDRVNDASSDQLWFEKEESRMLSDFPTQKTTKLVYLIDIGMKNCKQEKEYVAERAINFPHDGLCIEYKIDLPLQCKLIDLSQVHEWSPVINSSPQGKDDVAVFSQPVCVTVIIEEEQLFENFYWPRVIFRLCGEDYWGRFFVNGFGQLTLPSRPGRHQFDIKCWRYERKHDRKNMLFENFISEMADFKRTELTLASESAMCEVGPIASSIGLNIINSGILKINVQCIMQSREFISYDSFYKMKHGTLLRHDGMQSRIHWNILKVLSKFEEARRNLLKIRNQSIPSVNNKIS
ncbi:hypothetical protein X798_03048 [Onchocerca flexuosa]|uniref:Uncharacterized protein n=1 Tax=Onchocerca flexuosa TaxID=387005 RepID=A0A238BXD5_9BILA|nr:hypothetical protein X798_03048 [Onchocerca flexuosa]